MAGLLSTGARRHYVAIQQYTQTEHIDTGAPVKTYTTIANVWASIVPMRASERQNADQTTALVTHNINILHRTDLSPKDRIVHNDTSVEYEIVSIIDINGLGIQQDLEVVEAI